MRASGLIAIPCAALFLDARFETGRAGGTAEEAWARLDRHTDAGHCAAQSEGVIVRSTSDAAHSAWLYGEKGQERVRRAAPIHGAEG